MNPAAHIHSRNAALLPAVVAALAAFHVNVIAAAPNQAGCIAPPAGLVAWMPGDGNAQDIFNNAYDTSVSGTSFIGGVVGQAFNLAGTGAVTYATFNMGGNYTVDFWVRPTRSAGYEHLVSNSYFDGTGKYGALYFVGNHIEYWQGNSLRTATTTGSIPLNTYTHVALTYDGSVNRIYINGTLASTSSAHTETFNNPVALGYAIAGTDVHFVGQLDEVEIFNRALAASELQAIITAGSAGKCKTLVDADGDGVVDSRDACPGTPAGTPVNASGCPSNACFSPPANLINWFPGDDSVQDITSNANVESAIGVAFASGVVGQAMTFDGNADVVYSNINAGAAYTIDVWL